MLDKNVKKIYMIGIKGTGMSSLAVLLKKMGYEVTGSDVHETFPSEKQLKDNAIFYHNGFDAQQLRQAQSDIIVMSTAYSVRNLEVAEAKLLRLPLTTYPEAVGEISKTLTSVAVCGSHGKTTTTSMLGAIMEAGHETVTLTGTVAEGLNTQMDKPKFFVFEADEYQNKFQYYAPANVILTNIDFDHPDYFKDESHYQKTFSDFILRILNAEGYVVYNYDDVNARTLLRGVPGNYISYGFAPESDFQITDVHNELNGFSISEKGKEIMKIRLGVYGKHNILDAAAATLMALHLGVAPDVITRQLESFTGIQRRMQMYPSEKYIVMDDYGHHPTEIAITLEAIRNKYKDKNIVTVFHPHTFTRTKALLADFGKAFKNSDSVLVLDIYPSAREPADARSGVSAQDIVAELEKNDTKAIYTPTIRDAADYILENVAHGSVIVTMGAGDAWQLCDLIK